MTMKQWLKQAFATGNEEQGSQEDLLFIERIAEKVVGRGMGTVAILFLESISPLTFIGSQVLVFFEPIVKTFGEFKDYDRLVCLFERRNNVAKLIERIEYFENHNDKGNDEKQR